MARRVFAAMVALAAFAPAALGADSFSVNTVSPANGATVAGTISWEVATSQPASRADFYVDGVLAATDTSSPFAIGLKTVAYVNGTHVLKAVAYRSNGATASTQVSVAV